MSDIPDIVDRLLAAVKEDAPIQRALVVSAACEIDKLRLAISRLAEQDATLSVVGGNLIVEMDATLTDAERSLIRRLAAACEGGHPREWTNRALTADDRATLRGLLERLG